MKHISCLMKVLHGKNKNDMKRVTIQLKYSLLSLERKQ